MAEPGPALIEDLLSTTFRARVIVARWQQLAPWSVARCVLVHEAPALPHVVVVKWLRSDHNGFRVDPRQMLTERAALEFLADIGLAVAPVLVACDPGTRALVLEDLSPRVPLHDLLDGRETPAAVMGITAFARALGLLAAGTAGRAEAYYERRRALGPVDPASDREGSIRDRWEQTTASAAALGVPVSEKVAAEMASVLAALGDPGPFLAFSNGDAAANNFLVRDDDGRIIDFEFAGFRHALLDAACLHVPGPLWITLPDPVRTGLEAVYRSTLCSEVPEAADDRVYGSAMAAAAVAAAIERGASRFARLGRRPPGDGSRPQMIATLESAARAADHHRSLPHLAGWCRTLGETLRRRWPDANEVLTRLAGDAAAWVRR
jgi:hypothetical protein